MFALDLDIITLKSNGILKGTPIELSASKSESNRVLIINALSGNPSEIRNLSDARDTQTMKRLLESNDDVLDVLDAGTTMRFLTGYLAVTTQKTIELTGSARMQERPIKILVEALNELGASISYKKNQGYPPLLIGPFLGQKTDYIEIPSDVSSQYISALLMIAPVLPNGLTINLVGEVFSRPYIEMTLALMKHFGITHEWKGNNIIIRQQDYVSGTYTVESDWSGASYWYGLLSLAGKGEIDLVGLRQDSNQGDQKISRIMTNMGVTTRYMDDRLSLQKVDPGNSVSIDFKNCPDLAQTVMVSAAAQKIDLVMTGLESLRIKETDRIGALQNELSKVGAELVEEDSHHWRLESQKFELTPGTLFETYDDHRMAMAFAPLCMIGDIRIENPGVVAKSYPGFWSDLMKVGVEIR